MKIKRQKEQRDCGLYVIQALHAHYFNELIPVNELKHQTTMTEKGLNVGSLIELGSKYGMILDAFNAPTESLKSDEYYIAVINQSGDMHYVITKWNGKEFLIWDSAKGHYSLSEKEFSNVYKEVVLTIHETTYQRKEKDDITHIWKYLLTNVNLITWIIITLSVSLILSFTSTIFLKIVFDKVLPGKMHKLLNLLCIAFGFIAILRVSTSLGKSYFNKKLCNIIEIDLMQKYLNKFKTTNQYSISKIDSSDHLRRMALIGPTSLFLATGIQVIFDECITFVISSCLLIWISPKLYGVAMTIATLNALISLGFNFFIRDKYLEIVKQHKTEFTDRNTIIHSFKNLNEKNRASVLFTNWKKSFLRCKETDFKIWKYSNILHLAINLITYLSPILITFLAINIVLKNEMSVGSFLMFLSLFNFFISPLNALSDFALKIRQNLKHISLLQYILDMPDEKINYKGHENFDIKTISLKNIEVTLEKPILNISSLELNGHTKLIGSNGTGKTILINAVSGLIPYKGSISYNNIDLDYLNQSSMKNRFLIMSDQEYIPDMKIIDYISMKNPSFLEVWKQNDLKYDLTNFLLANGINTEDYLKENGSTLSQGQKQIVRLMRVFSHKYDVLVLDEAFEFISANNFLYLKDKIRQQSNFIIEVSHSNRFLTKGKEVKIEQINKCLR